LTATATVTALAALALSCARSVAPLPVASGPSAPPRKPVATSPVLTHGAAPTVLPIRDPILRPGLAVEATVDAPPGKNTSLWLQIDSGSPQTTLPPSLVAQMGLPEADSDGPAALGGRQAVVALPRLALGAVSVSGLTAAVLAVSNGDDALGLLGRPVLAQTAWEIAWNSGTLTLGAKPWPTTGAVRVIPLSPLEPGDGVEVSVAGRSVRMLVDTGAMLSKLPENLVATFSLETATYEGVAMGDAPGAVGGARLIIADADLGGIRFVRHRFFQSRAGDTPVLGLDLLARFDFQIVPGKGLVLKPRDGDLRATAAHRIRRWSWMPSCKAVGCARGRVLGSGKSSQLEMDFEARPARALQILMGCAERREPEEPAPWTDWTAPPETRGQHLKVQLKEGGARKLKATVPGLNFSLTLPNGAACRKLTVLDVGPMPPPGADAPEIVATVVP
jgi:predicted aspartyl protease